MSGVNVDLAGLITGLVGALGGGISVGWIAKTFFTNYIKTNDEKHKLAHNERKDILEKLNSVDKNLAVYTEKVGQLEGVKTDVIVLKEQNKKHTKDMGAAFEKLRSFK